MRLILNIKQIANELGLECWEDNTGFFNVRIGEADWDGTGINSDMVLRYNHGCYSDDWGHTAMKDEEFHLLVKQMFPSAISLRYVDNDDKLFSLLAGFLLVKKDIGAWRRNYFGAQYNREIDKILGVLN